MLAEDKNETWLGTAGDKWKDSEKAAAAAAW